MFHVKGSLTLKCNCQLSCLSGVIYGLNRGLWSCGLKFEDFEALGMSCRV